MLLCLVTFSVLSLSSAKADEKLSKKAADRVTEYYTASNEANETLSRIDEKLKHCYEESQNETIYYQNVVDTFSSDSELELLETTADDSDNGSSGQVLFLQWQTPITATQNLSVCLRLSYPVSDEDTFYEIVTWETENTSDWNPDLSQPVYQGS